jgi:hypothetical protein
VVKKTITYTNQFTDETVTEEHYFNISKADLIEMEMEMEEQGLKYTGKDGTQYTGMAAYLQRITDAEDAPEAYKWIKQILRRAYLKRVDDKPVKSAEIWAEFESSEGYSELVWGLFTDPEELARFIQSTFPGNLEQIATEVIAKAEKLKADGSQNGSATDNRQAEIAAATSENPITLTRAELVEMDDATYKAGLADGRFKLA